MTPALASNIHTENKLHFWQRAWLKREQGRSFHFLPNDSSAIKTQFSAAPLAFFGDPAIENDSYFILLQHTKFLQLWDLNIIQISYTIKLFRQTKSPLVILRYVLETSILGKRIILCIRRRFGNLKNTYYCSWSLAADAWTERNINIM